MQPDDRWKNSSGSNVNKRDVAWWFPKSKWDYWFTIAVHSKGSLSGRSVTAFRFCDATTLKSKKPTAETKVSGSHLGRLLCAHAYGNRIRKKLHTRPLVTDLRDITRGQTPARKGAATESCRLFSKFCRNTKLSASTGGTTLPVL
ncbi:Hypothetical predicted protein [Podarcis lilfordi]|uniref:Uncharacterized protein n=1 Tax=Podarcis lilfordi TaxID=74358 RepID=A0AA35PMC0_9SAUR|nr:Hypothetical predicted protein [Podarcis lilfordi]